MSRFDDSPEVKSDPNQKPTNMFDDLIKDFKGKKPIDSELIEMIKGAKQQEHKDDPE